MSQFTKGLLEVIRAYTRAYAPQTSRERGEAWFIMRIVSLWEDQGTGALFQALSRIIKRSKS